MHLYLLSSESVFWGELLTSEYLIFYSPNNNGGGLTQAYLYDVQEEGEYIVTWHTQGLGIRR